MEDTAEFRTRTGRIVVCPFSPGQAQCLVPLPAFLSPGFTFDAALVTLDPNFPSTVRSISLTTQIITR